MIANIPTCLLGEVFDCVVYSLYLVIKKRRVLRQRRNGEGRLRKGLVEETETKIFVKNQKKKVTLVMMELMLKLSKKKKKKKKNTQN